MHVETKAESTCWKCTLNERKKVSKYIVLLVNFLNTLNFKRLAILLPKQYYGGKKWTSLKQDVPFQNMLFEIDVTLDACNSFKHLQISSCYLVCSII